MNWPIPPFESQYSASTHTDAEDCVEESLCHIVYMMTGKRYSPRALAYFTQVKPNGSTMEQALAAVKQFGLIPYDLWPTPTSFSWESYYEPVSPEVLLQAEFYDIRLIPFDLSKSPGWTVMLFNNGIRHVVAQINQTQYFDSELGGPVKTINQFVDYRTSISLKRKGNNMQFKTQNYKGELRIVLQADDPKTWDALCKVYGVDQSKPVDETIN